MGHVRETATVASALAASDAGVPDAENAARHGVAVKTLRRWRREYQRRGRPRGQTQTTATCPRCDGSPLDAAAYAELLGWYLGDGYLTRGRRDVWALHVCNDVRYPADNARLGELMRTVKPGGLPHRRRVAGCVVTTVSWKHWPCLFPQHGPGRKHLRPIVLATWQQALVEDQGAAFLRGLFHSDGCRTTNRVRRRRGGQEVVHAYPRWQFKNASEDILGLCCAALDRAGVPWTRSGRTVSVSRRAAVEDLDGLVGPKA